MLLNSVWGRIVGVLIVFNAVLLFPVGGNFAAAQGSGNVVKIGAILDFTGPISDLGPRFRNGIELRLDQAGYEVAGKRIELYIEDGGSDAVTSLEKARKLVEREGVEVIIGPVMGGIQLALAPYLAMNNVTVTSLYNVEQELIERYDNWLGYPVTTYAMSQPTGWYAADELGYKTAVTLAADYAAGYSYMGGAVDAFKERGGVVVRQVWVPVDVVDLAPYLSELPRDVDVIFSFLPSSDQVVRLIQQHRDFGIKTPIMFTLNSGLEHEDIEQLGSKAVGVLSLDNYVWSLDTAENVAFVDAFEAKYGYKPGSSDQNAYTLTSAILAGLEANGGNTNIESLRPAVLSQVIETPQGTLRWNDNGVALPNLYIFEVTQGKDGEFPLVPLKTYTDVTDPMLSR